MKRSESFHLNDKTLKYQSFAQSKRQHQYLGLPGEFKSRLPQEMVFTDMTSARADELYCTDEDLLIDLEEESDYVDGKTLKKFAKYLIFISYWYLQLKGYIAVICHKKPKKEFECFEYAPSLYIHVHYIYFSQEDLWLKYENLINKVEHKETLTDMEALDMAFVSKFISKEHAPMVVERLCELFPNAIIEDKTLKVDVKVILSGMILKHIESENKRNKLMEMIGMKNIKSEIDELIYEEYGNTLDAKDEEIENKDKTITSQAKELRSKDDQLKSKDDQIRSKDNQIRSKDDQINQLTEENKRFKSLTKKLNGFEDLNSSEARNVLNSLLLLLR